MANQLSGQELYRWTVISRDGQPVAASNGLSLVPEHAMHDPVPLAALFLCGGINIQQAWDRELGQWLRRLAQRHVALGGLCTGAYLLARAELLKGYRCTIHWEHLASLREEFGGLVVSSEVFEVDRDRYTASGGTAPLDMMLHLIGQQHGKELASSISEVFICERIRGRNDRQRIPLKLRLGTSQPKLVEAVSLMEANIEEPMGPDELAHHVGLSRRQLERLFQKYLSTVPTRYYLELRLARARQLLLQTNMSIVDVAFACGFVSAPHFSKCYRDFFGIPPRDARRRRDEQSLSPASEVHTSPSDNILQD
ncbi:MAG: GlxA family transcriptional regulator, partial [Candidatus Competibacteraceae bacterium]|nr:GlxA family transcriptional regulator [Candidatus Competibacteraceae bacterium]